MNKYQEALDGLVYVKENFVYHEGRMIQIKNIKNTKLLQELVDKATPKKPKINHYDNDCTKIICPNDCRIQLNGLNKDNEIASFTHEYCPKCGQAIDWSEDE